MTLETLPLPKLLALPKRSTIRCKNRSIPTTEALLKRRQEIFDMRAEGKSYKTISRATGLSFSTISEDLAIIAKMKYQGLIETSEALLQEQNTYYDALLEKWLPLAVSEDLSVGETRENKRGEVFDVSLPVWESSGIATDKVLKILEQKAKVNGLMARHEKTPEEVGTNIAIGVIDAFRKLSQPAPIQAVIIENE